MKKITTFFLAMSIMSIAFFMSGCSVTQQRSQSNSNCPAPTEDQIDSRGNLIIEDGVTLKCQIMPFLSNMACQGITDNTNADGLICQNSRGQQMLFLFDENGVMVGHRRL